MIENIINELSFEYQDKFGKWQQTNSSDLTIRDRLDEMESEYGNNFTWTEIEVNYKYSVISTAYSNSDGIEIKSFILE